MQAIRYSDIPDKMFLQAIKIRDIRKARVLTRIEKSKLSSGSPDILLKSPLGFINTIYRDELVRKYTYISGQKISLTGWKEKNRYIVMSSDNTLVYAMYIPERYTISIMKNKRNIVVNKKAADKGEYIICYSDTNGNIDRDKVYVVSNLMFRKMFKFTVNSKIGCNTKQAMQDSKSTVKNSNKNINNKVSNNNKIYNAVARIVTDGNTVGFVIRNINGTDYSIAKKQLIQLCKDKKIGNIGVRELDGKEYIHGIGIKISEIPPL